MNLCYIDELLWHFNWTGDLEYARRMWPLLTLHLAWEKRNFDPDNDGLYDAYACIWASDALYYNSGAVTHSSAYNYRGNKLAALIAEKIGEDPTPYREEADKILKASTPVSGCRREDIGRNSKISWAIAVCMKMLPYGPSITLSTAMWPIRFRHILPQVT